MLKPQWHEARIFRPAPRSAIAQDIADALRRRIVTGDLPVNSRLPSMQKLATWYGVSLPTMQAALHIVRALGFVRVMPGVGTYVAQPREHGAALNHAWLRASAGELGIMRFAVDSMFPVRVAASIHSSRSRPLPRAVADLPFLAMQRSASRHSWPELAVRADVSFHRSVASAVPGAEIVATAYQRLVHRLEPWLLAAADRQRDEELSQMHIELAQAIRDGRTLATGRLARAVARREFEAIAESLG